MSIKVCVKIRLICVILGSMLFSGFIYADSVYQCPDQFVQVDYKGSKAYQAINAGVGNGVAATCPIMASSGACATVPVVSTNPGNFGWVVMNGSMINCVYGYGKTGNAAVLIFGVKNPKSCVFYLGSGPVPVPADNSHGSCGYSTKICRIFCKD